MAITRTSQLADIVKQAHPACRCYRYPATRTFRQYACISTTNCLNWTLRWKLLKRVWPPEAGCVCFHSLEDRMVKSLWPDVLKEITFPRCAGYG